ncbi:hypothetical protein [Actinophytocola oryzae]|uniref:hypothetical protein n=1 Tax=Actinophytocola oryzae TaxID=502181 RepID=UPI001FB894FB|nr:hypothetical protein [Actinophytocola oryzae]
MNVTITASATRTALGDGIFPVMARSVAWVNDTCPTSSSTTSWPRNTIRSVFA